MTTAKRGLLAMSLLTCVSLFSPVFFGCDDGAMRPQPPSIPGDNALTIPEPEPIPLPWPQWLETSWADLFGGRIAADSGYLLSQGITQPGVYTGQTTSGLAFGFDASIVRHYSTAELLSQPLTQEELDEIAAKNIEVSIVTGRLTGPSGGRDVWGWAISGNLYGAGPAHALLPMEDHSLDDLQDEPTPPEPGQPGKSGGHTLEIPADFCPDSPCSEGDHYIDAACMHDAYDAFKEEWEAANDWAQQELDDIESDYDEDRENCADDYFWCNLKEAVTGTVTLGVASGFGLDFLDCIDDRRACERDALRDRNRRVRDLNQELEQRYQTAIDNYYAAIEDCCKACPPKTPPYKPYTH